jgi:hypothetical protein
MGEELTWKMVRTYNHSSTESQYVLDDDFEAFKALTKTSLHATVAVSSPQNDRTSNRAVCDTAPRSLDSSNCLG